MKNFKLLLSIMLAVIGWSTAQAETVSPYTVDFNTNPGTGVHDFAVASNWKHIVPNSNYDGYGPYYMSYSYSSSEGIDGSGALLPYRQYAGDYGGGEVVKDILVTPVINGEVKMYVKASGLASTSNPSFVEFYQVNEAGTEAGELIQRFTADDYVADANIEGWSYVTISLSSAQRVGIRAQYVYLDNFSATSAEIVKEPKLTITSLSSVAGGTYYPNQNADGTTDITLKVKVTNNGEVDLVAGTTENYTLSLVKREYYGSAVTEFDDVTFAIPVDIAVGETAEFEATFKAPSTIGTGWMYLKVKENISGTTSSGQVQTQIQEYASKFIFDKEGTSYYSSSSATTTPINFGKITADATLSYEIYNSGSAPLTINSFTLPEPFTSDAPAGEFTVAGGEKKVIAITLPATTPGIFTGDLEINYTNFGKEAATYKLAISGTILDTSKNIITFDNGKTGEEANGQFPAGSIHADAVYISSKTENDVTNWYLQSVNSPTTKFITPLLTAEAGEAFTYDAWYSSYNSSCAVTVYTSTDRITWTQVDKQTYSSGINGTAKTFAVTIEEAGDYYIAFELTGNALIDNIYGLTLAEAPEHDWYVIGSDIPTTGTQNATYTASIDVKNIAAEADVITTATLYVDGEAVATQENISLEGNTKTAAEGTGRNGYSNIEDPVNISLSFKPHTYGELPAYIELKNGDKVVKTEEVTVNIAKEELSSDIAVGEAKTTGRYAPFYGFDMEQGAYADFYYSAEQLAAFGIKKGDVIKSIKFKSTNSSKTINSLTAEAWVGMEENGTFAAGQVDKDNMTHVVLYEQEKVEFGTEVEMVIDLSENPIVYDGTSEIRIYTYINGGGAYMSFGWEVDSNYPSQAFYTKNESSWSSYSYQACPVGYFGLDVQPIAMSGVVTEAAEGNPLEGATVTLYNEENDVEYSATTDAEGKYSIDVIQSDLVYTVTVTAENYQDYEESGISFANGSLEQNFVLEPPLTSLEVTLSEYGYSTFFYSDYAFEVPQGVTAYVVEGINGKTLSLVEVVDVIPAGCAVILEGEPNGIYDFNYTTDPETTYENLLQGTDTDETIQASSDSKYYVLAAKNGVAGFYYGAADGGSFTNKAHRAYLAVPVESTNGANAFFFDNATGIQNATIAAEDSNAPAYNLSGQRVDNAYKGVVIVNGKKILKK